MRRRTLLFLLTCLIPLLSGCESRVRVTHEMTWNVERAKDFWSADEDVVLTFVDYPHDYIRIRSTNLGAYLDTLSSDRLVAGFELTTVGGCRKSWKLVKVGDRDQWYYDGEFADTEGDTPRSQWDETTCLLPWR